MTSETLWPHWRAMLYSAWARATVLGADVTTRARPESDAITGQGTPVSRGHVLRILVLHELSKHPEHRPPNLDVGNLDVDERSLSKLLAEVGWPVRRVRRITGLHWRRVNLAGGALSAVHLAPVPWVVRLGCGSTRAADVASGAFAAMQSGSRDDPHLASIRRAMEEPPHPRVLVLREVGNRAIVEDGNHFVIATLLCHADPATRPSVPCLVGARPVPVPAPGGGTVEAVAGTTEP